MVLSVLSGLMCMTAPTRGGAVPDPQPRVPASPSITGAGVERGRALVVTVAGLVGLVITPAAVRTPYDRRLPARHLGATTVADDRCPPIRPPAHAAGWSRAGAVTRA